MHRRGLRAAALVLILLAAVTSPGFAAGPAERLPAHSAYASGFMKTVRQALASLFAPLGSIMDPDGATATASSCRGDSGSIMDPNICPAAGDQGGATTDRGSVMDPDG